MSKKDRSAFAIASLIIGVASLILGVASLNAWLLPFCGLPLSVAGLILGFVAESSRRHGMAIAGIVMCAVGAVLAITGFVLGLLLFAPPTVSPEIEERVIARQIVRFGEAYGDLVIKDASMEIRGRGSILPEDKANGIDQLVCYQVYISFVTKDESCKGGDIMHGIAARKGSDWDLNTYVNTTFDIWARHSCGDFSLRPPNWCVTATPSP